MTKNLITHTSMHASLHPLFPPSLLLKHIENTLCLCEFLNAWLLSSYALLSRHIILA